MGFVSGPEQTLNQINQSINLKKYKKGPKSLNCMKLTAGRRQQTKFLVMGKDLQHKNPLNFACSREYVPTALWADCWSTYDRLPDAYACADQGKVLVLEACHGMYHISPDFGPFSSQKDCCRPRRCDKPGHDAPDVLKFDKYRYILYTINYNIIAAASCLDSRFQGLPTLPCTSLKSSRSEAEVLSGTCPRGALQHPCCCISPAAETT